MNNTTGNNFNTTRVKTLADITPEEKAAAKEAKHRERINKISKAIKAGCKIGYTTSKLSTAEQETHIYYGVGSPAANTMLTIDTTIPSDIRKCIDNNYTLQSITYYKSLDDTEDDKVIGLVATTTANKLTLRQMGGKTDIPDDEVSDDEE